LFFLFLVLFCQVRSSSAQARIDPSLPEAPLPHKRAFLLFPGYDVMQQTTEPVAPLRPRQKFVLVFRSVTDVSYLVRAGLVTVYDEALGVGPSYGPQAGGDAELFGYNAASLASTFFFSDALVPALAHQDPRYFRKGSGPLKSRVWWALRCEFVAFSDRGTPMPNYGVLVGDAVATLLSDTYLPASSVSVGKNFEGYGIKLGSGFGLGLLHEFGGVERVKKIIQKQTDKLQQHDEPLER
jgi:hypothetical protein